MNRFAYAAAIAAGFAGYHLARLVIRNLDIASWIRAWEHVPESHRHAIRDSLLAEEGITSDGG